jgi:hypothetical protein
MDHFEEYERSRYEKLYDSAAKNNVRGILLVFYIWLISFTHLDIIFVSIPYYYTLKVALFDSGFRNIDTVGNVVTIFSWFLIIFGIVSGILIYKMKKVAVKLAKAYIILKLSFLSVLLSTAFTLDMLFPRRMQKLVPEFIFTLIYIIGISIAWYLYLCKSKRVKTSYKIGENKSLYM